MIDGIWQIAPKNIKINVSPVQKIIFINPSIEPSESVKPIKSNIESQFDIYEID